ncbi:MAG TPA: aminotransferase class V-fold PLP-dependent enzyme [Blastocatellia bacterium]|nr:aminotransferase class V-fold PLP-dependent enzyme [Blastocatellia bacterium]
MDINQIRRDTPGCAGVKHFNNAGSSLPPSIVLDSVLAYLRREAEIGGYEAAEEQRARIEETYSEIAALINASAPEIAVIENATRAWDMAFYAIPFRPGDRILTATAEYASNYIAYLQIARKTGAVVEVVPDDEHGQLSIEALRQMIDERAKLISITHVPTNGGLVNPAAEIGRIANQAGILYLLDACQSVGQMPIDVKAIGCHLLSATGRKYLRGPRGTGFLYVDQRRLGMLEPPFLDFHSATWTSRDEYVIRDDARRFENWETNYATKIGLGEAVRYARRLGLEAIWSRIQQLGDSLRRQLQADPRVTIHDKGATKGGIVTFSVEGLEARAVLQELRRHAINVWYSVVASTRLDMESRGLSEIVRASVHYYNTDQEIDELCDRVAALSAPPS